MNRGQWSNVEDTILQAAVRRYGLNEWSRVSSLLAHRTARQCKARWFDHLSPSLEQRDWTPAEDARLLVLVKAMPHAWRSVAAALSRPANAVVERYQQLLTQSTEPSNSSNIGVAPEFEAAIPDAVDLDEDQMEMLAEARARLANSKGRKEKRKARQKLMEAQKRASILKLRQEQRESGIKKLAPLKQPKSKFAIDYNKGVAFERLAPGAEQHTDEPHFVYKDNERSESEIEDSSESSDSGSDAVEDSSFHQTESALEQHYQQRVPFAKIWEKTTQSPAPASAPRIENKTSSDRRLMNPVDSRSLDEILKSLPPILHPDAEIALDDPLEQSTEPDEALVETKDLSLFNATRAEYDLPVALTVEGGTTLVEQELSRMLKQAHAGDLMCPSDVCETAFELVESEHRPCTNLHPGASLRFRPYKYDTVPEHLVEASMKDVERQYLQFKHSLAHEFSLEQSLLDEIYEKQTKLDGLCAFSHWSAKFAMQQASTVRKLNQKLSNA